MKVTVFRRNYSWCVDSCTSPTENCTRCYRATPIYIGDFIGNSGDDILVAHRDGTGMISKVPYQLCKIEEG